MTQIAAPIATADEIDGGGRLFQFHFEGSQEGIFGHYGDALARTVDLDADGEFIIGHGGFPSGNIRCRRSEVGGQRPAPEVDIRHLTSEVPMTSEVPNVRRRFAAA
jgi:hypothetical protein